MLASEINIELVKQRDLTEGQVTALCTQAFRQDYAPFLKSFEGSTHLLEIYQGKLVSHVLCITRWLQYADHTLLKTACVEGVATELSFRYQGMATRLMRRFAEEIKEFELGALSTSSVGFYTRLGWQKREGPLFTRTRQGLLPVPNEIVLVLALPKTPPIERTAALSVEWRPGEVW